MSASHSPQFNLEQYRKQAKDLLKALAGGDPAEPDLVQDILQTRSRQGVLAVQGTRALMVIEGVMSVVSNDTPRIVHHKLTTFYEAEVGEHRSVFPQFTSTQLAARLQQVPLARMPLPDVDAFFTDLASVWRVEGVDGLSALAQIAQHPLLRRALEMIRDEASLGDLCQSLEAQRDEELELLELRHRMVVAGIRAVWDLNSPEETALAVERAAAG